MLLRMKPILSCTGSGGADTSVVEAPESSSMHGCDEKLGKADAIEPPSSPPLGHAPGAPVEAGASADAGAGAAV